MGTQNTLLTGLQNFAGDFDKTLIQESLTGMDIAKSLRVRSNVKNKITMRKLIVNPGIRKLSTSVTAPKTPGRKMTEKELEVFGGMKIMRMIPEEYREKFADMMDEQAKEIPLAAQIWAAEFLKLGDEINQSAYFSERVSPSDYDASQAYAQDDYVLFTVSGLAEEVVYQCIDAGGAAAGESPLTHPAKWEDADARTICDGPNKLIEDMLSAGPSNGGLTAFSSGVIATGNAYAPITDQYKALPEVLKLKGGIVHMSANSYDAYVDDLESLFSNSSFKVFISS